MGYEVNMNTVIPKVKEYVKNEEVFCLPAKITVDAGFDRESVELFCDRIRSIKGYEAAAAEEVNTGAVISCCEDSTLSPEAYVLEIEPAKVTVKASAQAGASYALTTIYWLAASGNGNISCGTIKDEPRYGYRGFMLDVSRHFYPVEEVKKILEQMAVVKLNRFHWHLSDDQGYRIESKKFPKLNEVSSYRKETFGDGVPHGGYYTLEDIKEVVAYAAARNIEIIPEIDLPGHTTAIIAAYPEFSCSKEEAEVITTFGVFEQILCAGNEKVYEFLEELLEEICPLFPCEYFHIGGDEAPKGEWKKCPDCNKKMEEQGLEDYEQLQAYFTSRLVEILKKYGKTVIGWNETLYSGVLDPSCVTQFWVEYREDSGKSYNEALKGRKFICSNTDNFYINRSFGKLPLKNTLEYEPNINGEPLPLEQVLGVEAPLWTEYVPSGEYMEFMIYPRFGALAENGWCTGTKDYEEFCERAAVYVELLKNRGVHPASVSDFGKDAKAVGAGLAERLMQRAERQLKEPERIAKYENAEQMMKMAERNLSIRVGNVHSAEEGAAVKEIVLPKLEEIIRNIFN